MKFFWKIFFTTLFISVICVTLSGYILINSNFHSQLDSEVKTAQDYGEIVFYSLAGEFKDLKVDSALTPAEYESIIAPQIVQSINVDGMNQKITFGVMDTEQNTIFSSLPVTLNKSILSSLDDATAGWVIQKTENRIYVQAVRPAVYLNHIFYIETIRDVTQVFANQKAQYKMMIEIILAMIAFAGILTFVISKWLLRPIVSLTEITKTISDGNLSVRAKQRGQDEITLLSENFNHMADCLEEKICELKEEANRKELFVGAFSHELKTPLTSIIGYSDLLRQKEMSAEQRHICAEYIFSEGRRLETLSMRLLDLIVLKRHSFFPQPTEITSVIDKVAKLILPQLDAANISLSRDIEPALLPMEEALMETVFMNLIDNARKAIEKDGKILLTGQKWPGEYILTIQDSGKGMEKQELSKITEAFYMVDKSRARKQGGAGLGLTICKEILMLHGFDIQFDSTVNIGTTVTITIREGNKNEQI